LIALGDAPIGDVNVEQWTACKTLFTKLIAVEPLLDVVVTEKPRE
jgi:hypothetical protein